MSTQESNAFSVPEVLLGVYDYLDLPALNAYQNEEESNDNTTMTLELESGTDVEMSAPAPTTTGGLYCLEELVKRGRGVRSLTVGDRGDCIFHPVDYNYSQYRWERAIPPTLTQLEHLDLRLFKPDELWIDRDMRDPLLVDLVEQNPNLSSLEYSTHDYPGVAPLIELLYRHPLRHLKRLVVHGTLDKQEVSDIFVVLILRDAHQEMQRVDYSPSIWRVKSETRARLVTLPNLNLEELVIDNTGSSNSSRRLFDVFLKHCYLDNERPIGDVIRASYADLDNNFINVPNVGADVGNGIVRLGKNLKAIDLSHRQEIPGQEWDRVLGLMRKQLESVVAWDVAELGSRELLRLVPPSPEISRILVIQISARYACLQELDVSANPRVGSAIPMFFKYVPTLRILRALGVPVNATRMVGFDWVCKDMEVLAINLFTPRLTMKPKITWVWNLDRDGWDVLPDPENGPVDLSRFVTSEGEPASDLLFDDEEGSQNGSQAETVDGKQGEFDINGEVLDEGEDQEYLRWRAKEDKAIQETTAYSIEVQRQICQQLGRLSKLRELTLEGCQSEPEGLLPEEWFDCLHLTLESGLDYMKPLRNCPEKLVVYQLDEELCGREEMEWIAQNWVNYVDGAWQNGYREWKAAKGQPVEMPLEVIQEAARSNNPLIPTSAFRELIGIDVRGRC
ncbi:hypothetical protein BGX33_009068 [Mortierella sp. NVP41]|nr:hypothetical protein BGX33_009068 [Mortierella sp. NVP41]